MIQNRSLVLRGVYVVVASCLFALTSKFGEMISAGIFGVTPPVARSVFSEQVGLAPFALIGLISTSKHWKTSVLRVGIGLISVLGSTATIRLYLDERLDAAAFPNLVASLFLAAATSLTVARLLYRNRKPFRLESSLVLIRAGVSGLAFSVLNSPNFVSVCMWVSFILSVGLLARTEPRLATRLPIESDAVFSSVLIGLLAGFGGAVLARAI